VPLREALAVATRIGAKALADALERLAGRARLDLVPPDAASAAGRTTSRRSSGLTPRESEVLRLIARGYTTVRSRRRSSSA
jgi:DNA-binding NarL/FixJ family response regulator